MAVDPWSSSRSTIPHGSSRVVVERFSARYLVPRDHPSPNSVRRRLDDVVRARVPDALAAAFERRVRDDEPTVVRIRRLELDLVLDCGGSPAELAERWAVAITRALGDALEREGPNTVRFASHAEELARFMIELCQGRAWERWYYRRFDGLRPLPTSAALRTALLADPAIGSAALTLCNQPELCSLLDALEPLDADRVARELAASAADDRDFESALAQALELVRAREWPRAEAAVFSPERAVLELYVRLVRHGRARAGPSSLAAARALVALEYALRDPDSSVTTGSEPSALSALTAWVSENRAFVRWLMPLLAGPEEQATSAVSTLEGARRASFRAASRERANAGADPLETPYGGLFMLLPLLETLELGDLEARVPACGRVPGSALLRALVIAKAAGRGRARAVLDDPLWNTLLVGARLPLAGVAEWADALPPALLAQLEALDAGAYDASEHLEAVALPARLPPRFDQAVGRATLALLDAFTRRLPGFWGSTPDFVYANFLEVPARLEQRPDRCVVRLGRPPLYVILAMTGLGRACFRLPGDDPRPFDMFLE